MTQVLLDCVHPGLAPPQTRQLIGREIGPDFGVEVRGIGLSTWLASIVYIERLVLHRRDSEFCVGISPFQCFRNGDRWLISVRFKSVDIQLAGQRS
jgi:hypothetical protein